MPGFDVLTEPEFLITGKISDICPSWPLWEVPKVAVSFSLPTSLVLSTAVFLLRIIFFPFFFALFLASKGLAALHLRLAVQFFAVDDALADV